MIAIIFGILFGTLTQAQYSFEDCKKAKFEGKQCKIQKVIHEVGK